MIPFFAAAVATVNSSAASRSSRIPFFKFHRRNSTGSARSAASETQSVQSDSPSDSTDDGASASAGPPAQCTPEQRDARAFEAPEAESVSDEVEDGSLKRKRGSAPPVANLNSDNPPMKRRRTPSAGQRMDECAEGDGKIEETMPQPQLSSQPARSAISEAPAAPDAVKVEDKAVALDTVIVKSTVEETKSEVLALPSPPSTPQPQSTQVVKSPLYTHTPSTLWHATSTPLVAAKPSKAFSAFSGQSSAFAVSSFASAKAPAWSATRDSNSVFAPAAGTALAFGSPGEEPAAPVASTLPIVTGEEDEELETELKGVKVFIKRGNRDFCEGILGNAKLLKHKVSGQQRILFRREPVWKVTMSVRLRPAVRCSFEEVQGALRVALKEPIEGTQEEQFVIYVLRRGKASRNDFADFAQAIIENSRTLEQSPSAA
ncbi:uncharacterized protein BXZ73DRAFT_98581 [Epithele typhae]|uniref:uncharacterized protein n=1 Tax=Epithele typhae TaxID=378194 RepID=UPI002008404C|nr:uncharacterized protein BXZ73DRAFT_98581 [Epithele typhae]KAH9940750.1 hypothetical protein BXZ73DRAFT_98581 [Epithele typhae]